MSDVDISSKIKLIRKHQSLTQEELARQLGVSFPTVNAWEGGKSRPYPRHQKTIDELYQNALSAHASKVVLIVDDDSSSALVISDYVEMALPDWKPIVIDNGYDAILQIGLLKPNIVFLDIMMPEIDGLKVFQRIQEMSELKDTKVIFVTATMDEDLLDQARNAGAFALLQKPVRRADIVDKLQEASESILSQ